MIKFYDYKKANDLFIQAIELGSTEACYYLGLEYTRGDYKKEIKQYGQELFRKALIKNNFLTLIMFGEKYYYGHGIYKNIFKAFGFFMRASIRGSHKATFLIAHMFHKNKQIKDISNAVDFYKKAISFGSNEAVIELARLYYFGEEEINDGKIYYYNKEEPTFIEKEYNRLSHKLQIYL